jgi:hypothetical protein
MGWSVYLVPIHLLVLIPIPTRPSATMRTNSTTCHGCYWPSQHITIQAVQASISDTVTDFDMFVQEATLRVLGVDIDPA